MTSVNLILVLSVITKYTAPPPECPAFPFRVIFKPETLIQYWEFNDNRYFVSFPQGTLFPIDYWDCMGDSGIHKMLTFDTPDDLQRRHSAQHKFDLREEKMENPWLCLVKPQRNSAPYPCELPALLLAYKMAN